MGKEPECPFIQEKRSQASSCETCSNYVYDEDYGYYVCEASLDEDEMAAFLGDREIPVSLLPHKRRVSDCA